MKTIIATAALFLAIAPALADYVAPPLPPVLQYPQLDPRVLDPGPPPMPPPPANLDSNAGRTWQYQNQLNQQQHNWLFGD
jgi:hypothetical protein